MFTVPFNLEKRRTILRFFCDYQEYGLKWQNRSWRCFTMIKWVKWIGIFLGVSLLAAISLVALFWYSMKPVHKEEEKVTKQATVYLEKHMKHPYEIYDVLYDSMGNFSNFEYAAKVRDQQNGTDFLVYFDEESQEMRDTYVADQWQQEMKEALSPFIHDQYGKEHELMIFIDENVGYTFKRTLNDPGSYRDYDVRPTVRLTLHRKKQNGDEKIFKETIKTLQEDVGIQHGSFTVSYVTKTGEILEDNEWSKSF